MRYIVGISGPPRSGKDTLAHAINVAVRVRHTRPPVTVAQSLPMRQAVYALMGKTYDIDHYEAAKDISQTVLGGRSIREAMIDLSESYVIPTYGPSHWANVALAVGEASDAQLMIVSDMGFEREVIAMEKRVGADQCLWINLKRPGKSFLGDSRSYVGGDAAMTLDNPGLDLDWMDAAALRVLAVMAHWGWDLR